MTSRCTLVRGLWLAVLTGLALVGAAGPAAADPAVPTNYSSVVIGELPDGITAEVSGGDAFLVLSVEPGLEVLVPGYDEDEDYLRFNPDGTVEVNEASQAFYISAERYGAVAPPGTGPEAPPTWVQVSDTGTYAWHDHRIHWMSPALPSQVDPSAGQQEVFTWTIPLRVDGEPAAIDGRLTWQPDPLPVVPAVVLLATGAAAFLLVRRDLAPAAVLALVVGGAATAVLLVARSGLVPGAEVGLPPLVAPVVGALAPLAGAFVPDRPDQQRRGLVAIGGLALAAVGVLGVPWLLAPELPVDLAAPLVRVMFAASLGTGLGLLGVLAPAAQAEQVGAGSADDVATA